MMIKQIFKHEIAYEYQAENKIDLTILADRGVPTVTVSTEHNICRLRSWGQSQALNRQQNAETDAKLK